MTSTFPVITPGGFQCKSVANALMYYLVACRNYAIKCVGIEYVDSICVNVMYMYVQVNHDYFIPVQNSH